MKLSTHYLTDIHRGLFGALHWGIAPCDQNWLRLDLNEPEDCVGVAKNRPEAVAALEENKNMIRRIHAQNGKAEPVFGEY